MEYTKHITRRQLLGLGAVAAGSLLIPSIAYGIDEPINDDSDRLPNLIHRTTVLAQNGEVLASTSNNPLTRSAESNLELVESLTETKNQDGTISLEYRVKALKKSKSKESTSSSTILYEIVYTPTYFKMDGNICITKAYGKAIKKVSYASFQGNKSLIAHQGIAGSGKCHAEASFTTDSKTITTGFDQIPYVKSSDSNGVVANGGECSATLYVTGMGEQIIRAELYL